MPWGGTAIWRCDRKNSGSGTLVLNTSYRFTSCLPDAQSASVFTHYIALPLQSLVSERQSVFLTNHLPTYTDRHSRHDVKCTYTPYIRECNLSCLQGSVDLFDSALPRVTKFCRQLFESPITPFWTNQSTARRATYCLPPRYSNQSRPCVDRSCTAGPGDLSDLETSKLLFEGFHRLLCGAAPLSSSLAHGTSGSHAWGITSAEFLIEPHLYPLRSQIDHARQAVKVA